MNIKATDGSSIDTNDLSDVDGLIIKKQQELYDLCKKNNVPCYLITLITKGSIISSNTVNEKVRVFWNSLAKDIFERSNGHMTIAYIKPKDEEKE